VTGAGAFAPQYAALFARPWVVWASGVLVATLNVFLFAFDRPWTASDGLRNWGDWMLTAVGLVFGLAASGPGCLLVYAQRVLGSGWLAAAWRLPTLMVLGVGLAWSTSLAALGGLWSRDVTFVRTPKFGIGPTGGQWRDKVYAGRRASGALVEVALGGYCAVTAWLYWRHGEYAVVPFLLLYTAGFLAVGSLTMLHTQWPSWRRRRGA